LADYACTEMSRSSLSKPSIQPSRGAVVCRHVLLMSENRHLGKRAIAALTACLVLLLAIFPATASARIVPQKAIHGAHLGKTKAEIRNKLGAPDKRRVLVSSITGTKFVQFRYGKTKVAFDGTKKSSKVNTVQTKDPKQRTDTGVGVGSTKAKVKAGVPGVKCRNESGFRHCFLGKFVPGHKVTDFALSDMLHVTRVTVGFVID
jgi:hypothetical protein